MTPSHPKNNPSRNIRLPFPYAKRHGALVMHRDETRARILCRGPVSALALAEVRRHLGVPLQLEVVEEGPFEEALRQAYEADSGNAMESMGELGGEMEDLQSVADQLPEPEDLMDSRDDAPIIRLLNALFTEAIRENASDIHIEPLENRLRVRFRVDGVLREVLHPDRVLSPLVASRIKVMARLDIAEKRLPQDGRISLRIAGRAVDVRVSTLPGAHGERVVLRLLDKQAGRLDLGQIGMAPDTLAAVEAMIRRPHGIILVTGPTGSGKTTTLYGILTRLNDHSRNILTVEEPIEYYLDGIGQTQVNPKVDMSFARGLRAILRQDPDVVMVGEIRDPETARIAAQASLTGHLVLSTLHTNSAINAATRLTDMGVEPFLLASTLVGVLAQRLARRLCPDCKEPYTASPTEWEHIRGVSARRAPVLYRSRGCEGCKFTGYHGRIGIYELVTVDEPLRTMIHDRAPEHAMERHARGQGRSIYQDGIGQVLAGNTSLEEVLRVIAD
uniref:Type II secretion system protein E n=1 Tax=Candidatus Kentrum sp. FM TaxID=2126340 RepID=A0A450RZ94_9GAMM|nr:MAG: general secretion pathway protein E [Candidatus Kentron sp. FM]VFJ44966.1 MAG: general secretion pathway protein E [Candidatus Kentron sp. FM]VFK05953.1 MAG: general secretion pathway protein E [Candidatus Kentron sp. FM]